MGTGSLSRCCSIAALITACGGKAEIISAGSMGRTPDGGASNDASISAGGSAPSCAAGGPGGAALVASEYCNGLFSGQGCGQFTVKASVTTPNMLLVIDTSSSMNDPATPADASSKWNELQQVLGDVLPSLAVDANFGLEFFPNSPDGIDPANPDSSCSVPAGDAAITVSLGWGNSHVRSILDAVANHAPGGGSPVSKALNRAFEYFTIGSGQCFSDAKGVILVTDGAPDCNDSIQCDANACATNLAGQCAGASINCCDTSTATGSATQANTHCLDEAATLAQIVNLRSIGVLTYVIGLPGSEPFSATLDAMATAGGLANAASEHAYAAVSASNFGPELRLTLRSIAAPLLRTCDIELGTTLTNPYRLQAIIDCKLIPILFGGGLPPPDAGIGDGFYIDYNPSPAHLILSGTYCAAIQATGAFRLDVVQSCPSL